MITSEIAARQPIAGETHGEGRERARIDQSTRLPVLFYFSTALIWLLVATVLAFIASVKMHQPDFLGDIPWLTYGRVYPAQMNCLVYGWAFTSGMGVIVWLMARLSRVSLRYPGMLLTAGALWNVGILAGLVGILLGDGTSMEGLDFPPYVAPMLFISYTMLSVWALTMFRARRPGYVYVSLWYIVAALFWFPWLYATAQVLLFIHPAPGVMQGLVDCWYIDNVFCLWLTPVGLASAYYFIPKVIGKPVYNYYLASLGFWLLALVSSWTGARHLIGGPLPVWIPAVSGAASILMLIPVLVVAMNHHMTMRGSFPLALTSPTLRFTVFGAMCYTLVSLQAAFLSFHSVARILHFTQYEVGHQWLAIYAFFSMTMFGAMYYIVPRLVGCEWRSSALIKFHFWASFYGILLTVLVLSIAGLAQGFTFDNLDVPFITSVNRMEPMLVGLTIAMLFLLVAHAVFAYHFYLMLLSLGRPAGEPTLFDPADEHGAAPAAKREFAGV